jgi:hypothetical protein
MNDSSLTKNILVFLTGLLIFINIVTAQWVWQSPYPQGNQLNGVSFFNANIGMSVGVIGSIIKTTDGGSTWVSQTSGTLNHLLLFPLQMQIMQQPLEPMALS